MAKIFKVSMLIEIEEEGIPDLQHVSHQASWLLDLNSWPEIQRVSDVTIEEVTP